MTPKKQDLTLIQGTTFSLPVRWETEPIVYKPITGITQAAPCVVSAASHGVPEGWRVAIVSVKGMTQINAEYDPVRDSDYVVAKVLTSGTLELNTVNSSGYKPYTSGGYVQYNTPKTLTGYTARMSIKDKKSAVHANIWKGTTAYAVDAYVVIADGTILQAAIGGTSAATAPTGAGVDGTVTWEVVSGFTGATELLSLTTTNARIVIDTANYIITLALTATETAALTWKKGVYDLELVSSTGVVTALLYGAVTVSPEVTT